MLPTILIIVLLLAVVSSVPCWPYSSRWRYYSGGGLSAILFVLVLVMLLRPQ